MLPGAIVVTVVCFSCCVLLSVSSKKEECGRGVCPRGVTAVHCSGALPGEGVCASQGTLTHQAERTCYVLQYIPGSAKALGESFLTSAPPSAMWR